MIYNTILYYTILYYTILYYTILYYTEGLRGSPDGGSRQTSTFCKGGCSGNKV